MNKGNYNNMVDINTSEVMPVDDADKRCAPGLIFESGSCIRVQILIDYANAYNKENINNSIKMYPEYEILNPKKYKKYLLKELSGKLKGIPQRDWGNQRFAKHLNNTNQAELSKYTFRPEGPSGRFDWLNTLNIDDAMSQYEKKYPEFKFLGTVPIDFDDLVHLGISNIDFNKIYNNGKYKLGIVFNLDEHNQSGSHWVSMYANLKTAEIYFFDSYGVVPEIRIRKLMRRIARFCHETLKLKPKVAHNTYQHQKENSECGVYSMNFILRMLRGDNFDDVCKSKIPDKKINKCRNVYFGNAKVPPK